MSLTDTQLVLLSSASQREDHLATLPTNLKGGAAKKVINKLQSLGLVVKVPVKRHQPTWRTDENERALGLKITRAGLKALGRESSEDDDPDHEEAAPKKRSRKHGSNCASRPETASGQGPRSGSKQALIISLLSRAKGATLDQLVAATGWLPHTTRAALTGLRKKGHALAKRENPSGQTVYRIEQEGSGSRRAKDGAYADGTPQHQRGRGRDRRVGRSQPRCPP
jgi:hypothetical protein